MEHVQKSNSLYSESNIHVTDDSTWPPKGQDRYTLDVCYLENSPTCSNDNALHAQNVFFLWEIEVDEHHGRWRLILAENEKDVDDFSMRCRWVFITVMLLFALNHIYYLCSL